MEDLFVYVPAADELLVVYEGTGENITAYDLEHGYDGYLNYEKYEVNIAERHKGIERVRLLTKILRDQYAFSAIELAVEDYVRLPFLKFMDGGVLMTSSAAPYETAEEIAEAVLTQAYDATLGVYMILTREFAKNFLWEKFVVYAMSSGGVRKNLMYFETAAEAEAFCQESRWEWIDENLFSWELNWEEEN